MRRALFLLALAVLSTSSCGGKPVEVNPNFTTVKTLGYKEGYREGYEKGFKTAYEYERKVIKEYLNLWGRDILAYEVGKYAVEESIVAPPKLYREGEGERGAVETGGQFITPEAVEKLSLLSVPEPYFPKVPVAPQVPSPDLSFVADRPTPYKIGYAEGFRKGAERGFRDGREKALEEFYKSLSPDSPAGKKFLYLELDKYLSPDLKVSAPRIYRVVKGNRVYYFLVPSRIEDIRTPQNLLEGKVPLPEGIKEKKKAEGVALPLQALPYSLPSSSPPSTVKAEVPCGKLEVVSGYGAAVEVENDRCYAVFSTEAQKKAFCESTNLCGDGNAEKR